MDDMFESLINFLKRNFYNTPVKKGIVISLEILGAIVIVAYLGVTMLDQIGISLFN